MITHHTELLNALIEKYNLKSYLEIGAGNLGYLETTPSNPLANFNKIKCQFKFAVDPCLIDTYAVAQKDSEGPIFYFPETSDDFFAHALQVKDCPFDIIFLDGDHTADQVKRDFENSLRCLSDNGFIVIHDVLPDEEQYTTVPRETKKWYGNIYQFTMSIGQYPEICYKTFDIDCGCMVIWRCPKRLSNPASLQHTMNWNTYLKYGRPLMNVTNEVTI